ncbi:tyrosine-type recombinase/integrase [Nitrobacter sp.]|uniref:tyrosine-type recombinase/integrase n=1 Tax=Nitrobacter sp. TaxID=29420 RepID=UPI003F64C454
MASVRKRTWTAPSGETKTAWMVDYADSRGDRQRKHFPTKKAADAFRISVEGQLQTGIYRPDASKLTMQKAAESFLERCKGRHARDERMTRKMLVVYTGHVNNHILHRERGVAAWKLSQLTAKAVGEFRDRLRTAGVSVPTTRKILSTLHGIIEHAVSQDWIATNAAQGVRVIGSRSEGSKKVVPPPKEAMRALLANAADDDLRLKLIFAASTGARAGEQWAAKWDDVDFDKSELNIRARVDAYGEEGAPKSAAGVRTVPLSDQLMSALKAWKLRSKFSKPSDLIFPNKQGRHTSHDNLVKRRFLPLFAGLGLERFNWHGLRHFAISCWIEAGMSPKTVQTFAGHASLQVTMDRYGHLFPSDSHKRAMDQIAKGLFS